MRGQFNLFIGQNGIPIVINKNETRYKSILNSNNIFFKLHKSILPFLIF